MDYPWVRKTASRKIYKERDVYGCDECKMSGMDIGDCIRRDCAAKMIGRESITTKFYPIKK